MKKVAIVGAGFSGTLVAAQLARRAQAPLAVTLFERTGRFGPGLAYRTSDEAHLLNVSVGGMSAWPDRPQDFLEWARRERPDLTGREFLPRVLYGRYLDDILAQAGAQPHVTIDRRAAEVRGLSSSGPRIRLFAGDSDEVFDTVVLALGNPISPTLTRTWPALAANPERVISPWDGERLRGLPSGASIAIIGTGLTAVDALMSLDAGGHLGAITAVSRHGLLPRVHPRMPSRLDAGPAEAIDALLRELVNAPAGTIEVTAAMRAVRRCSRLSSSGPEGLQALFDRLRPWTAKIWQALGTPAQKRFLRHARRHWDVHRHRMAPEAADSLDGMRRDGRLTVLAGRVEGIERSSDGRFELTLRPRGALPPTRLTTDYLIDSTGVDRDVRSDDDPFVQSLLAQGFAQADPHAFGFCMAPDGALIGKASAPLYALGSWRRGELWESSAVPELRLQAEAVATAILAEKPAPKAGRSANTSLASAAASAPAQRADSI